MDIQCFNQTFGTHHSIASKKSFHNIISSKSDHQLFWSSAIIHVANILSLNIPSFSKFSNTIPPLTNPSSIPLAKQNCIASETLTRNRHQHGEHGCPFPLFSQYSLHLPKSVFEWIMFFVLGDHLTTSRDQVAQDQRAVDHLPCHIDQLACFSMASGLVHQYFNMIQGHFWGETSTKDYVPLLTLCDLLSNWAEVNPCKIDFYAWLCFLNVVLLVLVILAALVIVIDTSILNAWVLKELCRIL